MSKRNNYPQIISKARRIRRELAGTKQPCDECGKQTKDLYWISATGKPITLPLCRDCHEQAVRRLVREISDDLDRQSRP